MRQRAFSPTISSRYKLELNWVQFDDDNEQSNNWWCLLTDWLAGVIYGWIIFILQMTVHYSNLNYLEIILI